MKTNQKKTTLDGATWETVRPAGNDTIAAAADGMTALAVAIREWADAKQTLEKAEQGALRSDAAKTIKAAANELNAEADKRRAADAAHANAIVAKADEVAAIYPALSGNIAPLMEYAKGKVAIDKPVTDSYICEKVYTPEITDANRKAVAAFQPVRRAVPDTDALTVPEECSAEAFAAVIEARTRYEAACRDLAEALRMSADRNAHLRVAAETEAATIEAAAAKQAERDAE